LGCNATQQQKENAMFRKSISSVFIASVTLALVLAVGGIAAYVTTSSYRMALGLEGQAMNQSAQAARQALGLYVENARGLIESLAGQRLVLEAFTENPEPAQVRLRDVLKSNPLVWSVLVFDDRGVIRAGANADGGDLRGQSRADRDYFKAIMGGQDLFLGKTVLTAKSGGGNMYIFLAVKAVRDASGRVIGGVGIFPRWENFTERFIDPPRFGERGYGFMLDGAGKVIAHATDKALMLQDLSGQEFVRQALALQGGSLTYDWKGEKKHLSVETDPVTGWKVCMSAYEDELTATARNQRNTLAVIGAAAVLLLGGALALLAGRLVARPSARSRPFTRGHCPGRLQGRAERPLPPLRIRPNLAANSGTCGRAQEAALALPRACWTASLLPCAVADTEQPPHLHQQPPHERL
jgi:methyl-accepting chemotaxis protein